MMVKIAVIGAVVIVCSVMCGCSSQPVHRYGSVIGVKTSGIPEYKRLHAAVWPDVLKMIKDCHIRNYSIYLGEVAPGEYCLFSYNEYTGSDLDKDMAKMAADKTTQEWWKECKPLQEPLETRKEGEWWSNWEEVFHYDGPAEPKCEHPKRFGSIIGIAKESILAYTQLHAAPWPGVIAAIEKANIRNYSIYLGQIRPGEYCLFSYMEYVGDDFDKDMAEIAKDPVSQEWWKYTNPLQTPLPTRKEGEHWSSMEEVFHMD